MTVNDEVTRQVAEKKTKKKKIMVIVGAAIGACLIGSAIGVIFLGGHCDHWGTPVSRCWTGYWMNSSAAIADGKVYTGSWDNNLYALDAKTGEEKWRFKTGDWVLSTPAAVNGMVYFGSLDGNLYALNARTGRERWRFQAGLYRPPWQRPNDWQRVEMKTILSSSGR